jgi:hypothetical protein
MSDTPQGDGWWHASDGKWYPPESAPPSFEPVAVREQVVTSRPRWWPFVATAVVSLLIGVAIGVGIGKNDGGSTKAAAAATASASSGRPTATKPTSTTTSTTTAPLEGGRRNPVPLGTPMAIGDGWTLKVNSFSGNADAAIQAANQFNSPPPDGHHFALVNVDLTYNGANGKASDRFFGSVAVLGTQNVPHTNTDNFCVGPDALDQIKEVFAGGTITGNICLTLPADEQGFVLFATGDFTGDKVFFALS